MKKDKKDPVAYALSLIGIVFLAESTVFVFVLNQIPYMMGQAASTAWVYAAIKFIAGIVALYAGLAKK